MQTQSSLSAEDVRLAKVISSRKIIFFNENAHLPLEERQRGWDEMLAHMTSTTSPQLSPLQVHTPSFEPYIAQQAMSRSLSNPIKKRRMGDGSSQVIEPQDPLDFGRGMHRKRSSTSHIMASPTISRVDQSPSDLLDQWLASELPYSAHDPIESSMLPAPPHVRHRPRPIITKTYEPGDFCTEKADQTPLSTASGNTSNRLSPQYFDQQYPPSQLSSSPYSDSFTSPVDMQTNLTSIGMSRATSGAGTSFCGGLENMRITTPNMSRCASNVSQSFNIAQFDNRAIATTTPEVSTSTAAFYPPQALSYIGGATDGKRDVEAANRPALTLVDEDEEAKMERTSSSESRISRRSREQAASGSRVIAPAAASSSLKPPANADPQPDRLPLSPSQGMSRTQSSESQNGRVAIPREQAPYPRHVSDKVKCDQCDMKPEGYRGEHELQRHKVRAHALTRKVYVCVEDSKDGRFLSQCEQCKSFKQYGAYYNAAAHLRRKHFNKRPIGVKKKGKLTEKERRGGKGGGTEPPMCVLKKWMHEFEVNSKGEPVKEADIIYSPSKPPSIPQQVVPSIDASHDSPSQPEDPVLFDMQIYNDFPDLSFDDLFSSQP